jgi:hypothetical protein
MLDCFEIDALGCATVNPTAWLQAGNVSRLGFTSIRQETFAPAGEMMRLRSSEEGAVLVRCLDARRFACEPQLLPKLSSQIWELVKIQ